MNLCIKKWCSNLLWTGIVLAFFSVGLNAQNATKKTIRSYIEYYQDHNNVGRLITTMRIREDRNAPLKEAMVYFYGIGDTSKILLDTVRTNNQGQAICVLDDIFEIYKDSLGLMRFESEFVSDQNYKGTSNNIDVQTTELSLTFFQRDSIKYIAIEASELRRDGTFVPIKGIDMYFYIKGTFSLLNIGDAVTNQEGRAILEFPVDMPGDTGGVLTIVSKIEDHDLYGNLETQGKINWGIPVPIENGRHRGLGDTDAPLWMVYTLIVLLSAVWFHYFYVIFMIYRIKSSRTKIPPIQELMNAPI